MATARVQRRALTVLGHIHRVVLLGDVTQLLAVGRVDTAAELVEVPLLHDVILALAAPDLIAVQEVLQSETEE